MRDLQAEVVAVTPDDHDVLVSFVSHVPQLAASTLMDVATTHEAQHRALLRLAAGGFRDMTRIAASQPTIWLDILASNRDAVVGALDAYMAGLQHARDIVAAGDRDALSELLGRARSARRNLPVGISMATKLVELRIPVPDRPGVLSEVTTLAGRLGVNVADMEIAHSKEGGAGVLVLIVAADDADGVRDRVARARLPHRPDGHRMSTGVTEGPDRISQGGARPLRGRLRLPGDKSISHRALIFAALADGRSAVTNLATGADVRATARVLTQLGVDVRFEGDVVVVRGRRCRQLRRSGRRARLREQRHDDARARRCARGSSVPVGTDR